MLKILLVILVIVYVVNPYDIVPDLFPGVGWLDDLFIVGLLWRYLASKKPGAKRWASAFQQRSGTDRRQKEDFQSGTHESGGRRFESGQSAWDPYRVLGVDRQTSPENIKRAYRRLVNQYHPDKVTHLGPEFKDLAEKRFKEIQRAYQEIQPKA
jgi:DnaJ like chaperone protein